MSHWAVLCEGLARVRYLAADQPRLEPATFRSLIQHKESYVNLYSGVSDRSHFKAAVQRQPQVRTMLEWRRLAANRKVRRMAASIPNTAPLVHFTPSRSRYQFILLGEQRHMCVNNLPRTSPSSGTAGNRTRDLSITNPTPYHYTTKPHALDTPPGHNKSTLHNLKQDLYSTDCGWWWSMGKIYDDANNPADHSPQTQWVLRWCSARRLSPCSWYWADDSIVRYVPGTPRDLSLLPNLDTL